MIRHNIRSRSSMKNLIKEFEENESYRLVKRRDSVKLFHTVLSFSNKDTQFLNDKILKDIAKKFIAEFGNNCLHIGTKHINKSHIHLHIATSGTQLNGRSSRISKQHLHHIKIELDKFQKEKYPELVSLPEHGKNKKISKEKVLQTIKAERQTNKETLLTSIEKTYAISKSKDHFLSQLKKTGHEIYYRNGRLQGVKYQGKKYRLNRLGFDEFKLQSLGLEQSKEAMELTALKELRTKSSKELIKNNTLRINENDPSAILDKEEQKELDELSTIRNNRNCIEKEVNSDVEDKRRIFHTEEFEILPEEAIPTLGAFSKLIKPITFERE